MIGGVEWLGRAVIIDGERFPCSDSWSNQAGTFYRIPLGNGLFACYCHDAPEGDDPRFYPPPNWGWNGSQMTRPAPTRPTRT